MTPITPRVPESGTPTTSEQSAPSPVESTSAPVTQPESPWTLEGRMSLGASLNGGRNGSLFDVNPVGTLGEFTYFDVAGALLYDLTQGDVRLRMGGQLSFNVQTGNENTGGSNLYSVQIGPRVELDWRRAYGTGLFAGPSRFNVDVGVGYGGGTTIAETFSLHDQSGLALSLGAALNLLNVTVGDLEFGLDVFARTSAIFGSAFNSPFDTVGGAITLRGAAEHPVTQEIHECTETNYRERLDFLVGENQQLRESFEGHRALLTALQSILEARGIDRASLVQSLREGYETYLETRETDPVADAAERQRLATERFPDDFDPFNMSEVPEVTVPEPLPEDCDGLFALVNQLEDERAALNHRNGLAEGTIDGILMRIGVPSSTAPHLIRAITRLQEVHFITNRPFGAARHERGYVANGDISGIDQATEAYLGAHPAAPDGLREARPLAELEDLFRGIFPRTRDHGDGTWYSPSLRVLSQVADSLRDPDMAQATFYIVGNTDSRGADDHNQGLSERRARAIRDALIMMGVPAERLVAIGRGERNLIYYYDQRTGQDREHLLTAEETRELRRDGITGTALTDEITGRQTTNRRVEMYICFPSTGSAEGASDQVCIDLSQEPAAAGANPTPQAAATEGSAAPVVEVPSAGAEQASPPPAEHPRTPRVHPESAPPPPPPPAEHPPVAPREDDE